MGSNAYERPVSPLDGVYIKDDFIAHTAVTTGVIGELGWDFAEIAGTSTTSQLVGEDGAYGILRNTTSNGSGDGTYYRLFTDGISINDQGGGFSARVRYPTIAGNVLANNDFRIGVDDSIVVTAAGAPAVGVSVVGDAGVLTLRSDSTNGDASAAVAGVSTLTSGTTMVINTWHTLRVEWTGANANGGPRLIELFVDDELGASIYSLIGASETMEAKIIHAVTTTDTLEWDCDYFEFWQWR